MLNFFKKKPEWIYGTCHDRPARKHRKKGNVQFILWKAGEQGHKEDYWHNFDSSWWNEFKPEIKNKIEDLSNEERWCSVNAFVAACTAISKIPSQKIETIDDVNNFQDLLKQQGYSILPISLEQRIEELKGIIKVLGTTH